jgi:hypothetical protein
VELFDELISAGLDGVEVDHRDHSESEKSELIRLAIERDLIVTGSSDYHGTGKLNQLAEYTTHPRQWEALEARADASSSSAKVDSDEKWRGVVQR